ncbi:hypothetical protein OS493_020415 [Desmophyllum pertusum]|uniref:Uncharacterized protein n=1 Tax=Desmophyllum pertusum TaxID=174260 RepID=A0A9W9ZC26_9CNID|nr:hypothetical protein OS493_020415 [Desmophyllum pertusum]
MEDMWMLFWKKPISDNDTFKFVLFVLGNWCSPALFVRWIMLSQFWAAPATAEKRTQQIDFIINNVDTKTHTWFYYNLDHKKLLFLDGLPWNSEPSERQRKIPAGRPH